MEYVEIKRGMKRIGSDDGLIASGSIFFETGVDVFTTEKKTSSLLLDKEIHPDGIYLLVIEKPVEDTALDLTVIVYNEIKTDGSNSRDFPLVPLTVEKKAGVATYQPFIIQGAFIGEGTIKIGMVWGNTDGGVDKTVYFKLYRI